MTIYYYDLFTGTAGTLLTSHTADSGATWPTDTSHLDIYEGGTIELDGNGFTFLSTTGGVSEMSSATMPSTDNFEVLFDYVRYSDVAGGSNAGIVLLTSAWPSPSNLYFLFYQDSGSTPGWVLYSSIGGTNTQLTTIYPGPALGVTWYMKADVSTSGGNTTFTLWWSTASAGPFNNVFTYTMATDTTVSPHVALNFYNPTTASTATTGQHIGALTVQDIPALSSATLSGPTQQLFSNPAEFTVIPERAGRDRRCRGHAVQLEWLGHIPGHAGWGERHEHHACNRTAKRDVLADSWRGHGPSYHYDHHVSEVDYSRFSVYL